MRTVDGEPMQNLVSWPTIGYHAQSEGNTAVQVNVVIKSTSRKCENYFTGPKNKYFFNGFANI